MYPKLELFVGGQWKNGGSRKTECVINPSNEKVLAELPHANKADLDDALEASKRGFETRRKTNAWTAPAL